VRTAADLLLIQDMLDAGSALLLTISGERVRWTTRREVHVAARRCAELERERSAAVRTSTCSRRHARSQRWWSRLWVRQRRAHTAIIALTSSTRSTKPKPTSFAAFSSSTAPGSGCEPSPRPQSARRAAASRRAARDGLLVDVGPACDAASRAVPRRHRLESAGKDVPQGTRFAFNATQTTGSEWTCPKLRIRERRSVVRCSASHQDQPHAGSARRWSSASLPALRARSLRRMRWPDDGDSTARSVAPP